MADFEFKVEQDFGAIGQSGMWSKKLTLTSWAGKSAKYDLRSWTEGYEKLGKGITMSKEELIALRDLLNSLEL